MAEKIYRVEIYGPEAYRGRRKVTFYEVEGHPFWVAMPGKRELTDEQRKILGESVKGLGKLVSLKGEIILELKIRN